MIALDQALLARVADYLSGQRWYAGTGPEAPPLTVVRHQVLDDGPPALHSLLVEAGDATYQLVLGARPEDDALDFLHGSESSVIGVLPGDGAPIVVYDALLDQELARALLDHVTGGAEDASHVRPIAAEQSNSSLVYDDRLILKLF